LVATEYVTKWVEAEALLRATKDSVIQFLFHIFVRYRLPRDIIADGGPQFASNKVVATLKKYHIQRKITTPYHPQENGQIESNNKIIEAIPTKTIAYIDVIRLQDFRKPCGLTEQHGEALLAIHHTN